MTFEEIEMAVRTAHGFGKMVNVHARSIQSIRHAVRAGVDMIYHAEYTDEETLDMLEAAKDRIFVAPTIGLFHTMVHDGAAHGMPGPEPAADQRSQRFAHGRLVRTGRTHPNPGAPPRPSPTRLSSWPQRLTPPRALG